jgi:hypothetical protein
MHRASKTGRGEINLAGIGLGMEWRMILATGAMSRMKLNFRLSYKVALIARLIVGAAAGNLSDIVARLTREPTWPEPTGSPP